MPLRRAIRPVVVLAVLAGAVGCTEDEDHENRARPPAAINVTAAVTGDGITVSPRTFGAGPIVLVISNQTDDAQAVTFESDGPTGGGPGLSQTTSPINPAGTATIEVDVSRGSYRLRTATDGIRATAVRVDAERASAQNELLTP